MFAWTSVQAIFATPGVELIGENKQMGMNGKDFARWYGNVKLHVYSCVFRPAFLCHPASYS